MECSVEGQKRPSKGFSQEGLKAIACATMLLDHIGAVFVPGYYGYYLCRIFGRIAFPVYCFLLAEGIFHTRDPRKYGLRLALGALVSELPFDVTFYGRLTWAHQNVMVTLLLGRGVHWPVCLCQIAALAQMVPGRNRIHRTLGHGGASVPFLWNVPIELFGMVALVPIFLYSGEKRRAGKGGYLLSYGFYPIHLTVLLILKRF